MSSAGGQPDWTRSGSTGSRSNGRFRLRCRRSGRTTWLAPSTACSSPQASLGIGDGLNGIVDPRLRLDQARERAEEESPGNPYYRARLVALAAAEYHEDVARWL